MMTLPSKLKELEIPQEEPFKNDILGMEQYASTLKSLVEMYAINGGVIALNGDWGTGKTTFSRMWKAYLEISNMQTMYFNAWETDYYKDPLTAIVGELRNISKKSESYRRFCIAAEKIVVNITKNLLFSLLKRCIGVDSEGILDILNSSESALQDRIKDYEDEKTSIKEFKEALSKYVADCGAYPLVFIIDELDRCNPHYAVKLLETIKHIFDVPNIVFVLSISRKELENSIRGYYGSDRIDASNYLRRFIDIQFDMPSPSGNKFFRMLIKYYSFDEHFTTYNTNDSFFVDTVDLLFRYYEIDLRTWDRIFSQTRLSIMQLGAGNSVITELTFLLCFIKIIHPDLYSDIKGKKLSVQELINSIEDAFPQKLIMKEEGCPNHSNHALIIIITELLYLYDYAVHGQGGPLHTYSKGKQILDLQIRVMDKEKIKDNIDYCRRAMTLDHEIQFYTDIVDLACNFKD